MVCQQLGPGKLRAGAAGEQEWDRGCPSSGGPTHTGPRALAKPWGLGPERVEGQPQSQRAAPTPACSPGHPTSQTVLFPSCWEVFWCAPRVPQTILGGSCPGCSASPAYRRRRGGAVGAKGAAGVGGSVVTAGSCREETADFARRPVPSAQSRGQARHSDAEETEERDVPTQAASSLPSLGAAWSERGNDYLSGSRSGNWTHSTKTRKHCANWV